MQELIRIVPTSTSEEIDKAYDFLDINSKVIKYDKLEEILLERAKSKELFKSNKVANSILIAVFNNLLEVIETDLEMLKAHYKYCEISEQYKDIGLYVSVEQLKSLYRK